MKQGVKRNREYYTALLFIMLAVILWGISFISTKVILKELPPVSIAFFRQIIALTALIPWLLFTKSFSKIPFKYWGIIVASGFLGIVLYFIFENSGLKLTTASNASMIVAAVPVFTLITEMLFFKLKTNLKIILCLSLSIVGAYLVITVNGKLDFSSSMFFGNLLVVGAMLSWVGYTILNKSLNEKFSSVLMLTCQTIASVFLFIPFIIPEIPSWKGITLISLLNLIYLGLFCSALAYFFYIHASKRLGSTMSSAFLNLIPVVSVIAGYFIVGERLALIQIVGMALIMLSLYKLNSN